VLVVEAENLGVKTVVEDTMAGMAALKDILVAMVGSLGMAVAEMDILIGKVEKGNYFVFVVGILVMEGMAEYSVGMEDDLLDVVGRVMSMLVVVVR
jgi:hypothetical protein